jgi:ABC-type antimicrobial peptide transport system permease subunit
MDSEYEVRVLNIDTDKRSELINKVSKDDNYVYTIFNDELREYNKKIFDSYTLPSIIIIIFTLIIGYIIIININLYNLLNQKKNLSIFRSLGFGYNEISRNWFMQSLMQWIISIIIGIPCGILLSRYFLYKVSSPRREFIYANGFKEYVITMLLLLLYIYIGHRKTMRVFRKMDIVEEVKDKD